MNLTLSDRVQAIQPSATLAITARAAAMRAEGRDVIGLGAGEPDFDTPEPIKEAARQAIAKGYTKYTAVGGTASLKQAIMAKFQRDNHLSYVDTQVLVSCGGKQSSFNLTQALLNPGDEVIIPAPYWVSYPDMVLLAGGVPVIVAAGQEQGFKITPEQLRHAITPKTRLLFLNSPSNPTGVAYSHDELAALASVLLDYPDIIIATDDMYEHILWQRGQFVNIVNACPALYERTLVMNGVSKAYSMTGWRIGYAAGPEPLIKAMTKIQSQSTSNPTSISQYAAEAALNGDQSVIDTMLTAFKQRHDYVVASLNAIPGIECLPTDGTFYVFPSIKGILNAQAEFKDDVALAEHWLESQGVAVVPGTAFGAPGHIRISIATGMDKLEQALARIAKAVSA
ncbi:MAG: pyridoxal phosphate-dependent aminotransferase [Methylococcales bacterium]|nr:pyridoxal phosphate-dependent aminotransferase [Methylococcales bacterium]